MGTHSYILAWRIPWTIPSGHKESDTTEQISLSFSLFPSSVQSLSFVQLCTLMDCGTPGFPVHHQLPEMIQTCVWVTDAIQPSHPLLSPSPPAFNLSQHQGLFQRVDSLHQVAKVLEFQLQHQSFQ